MKPAPPAQPGQLRAEAGGPGPARSALSVSFAAGSRPGVGAGAGAAASPPPPAGQEGAYGAGSWRPADRPYSGEPAAPATGSHGGSGLKLPLALLTTKFISDCRKKERKKKFLT